MTADVLKFGQGLCAAERVERGRALVQWFFEEQGGAPGPSRGFTAAGVLDSYRPDFEALSSTRVYAVETPPTRQGRPPAGGARCGGRVARAIGRLDPKLQNWVHYCYNPSGRQKMERVEQLAATLWAEYSEFHITAGMHGRTIATVYGLFRLQLFGARTFWEFTTWCDERPPMLRDEITPDRWKKTHGKHWRTIRDALVSVDMSAMIMVHKLAGG